MRNTIILIITLSIPIFLNAQKGKLVGKWEVVTIDGEAPDEPNRSLSLTLFKDGSMILEENNHKEYVKWQLNEDQTILEVYVSDERKEELRIVELKGKEMSLDNRGSVAVFKKTGKAKITKFKVKGVAKKIIGNWSVVEIDGKNMEELGKPIYIQFNKDGTVWTSAPGPNIGTWKLSKSQKQIIIGLNGRDDEVNDFELSEDKNTLMINDRGTKIRLERQPKKMEKPSPPSDDIIEEPNIKMEDLDEPIAPNAIVVDATQIVGDWKVIQIDEDPLEGRELRFVIRQDGSFKLLEDGEVKREGAWDLEKSSTVLAIKDQNNNRNSYTLTGIDADTLKFSDSYGEYILQRQ